MRTRVWGGSTDLIWESSARRRHARPRGDVDLVEPADAAEQPLRGGKGEDRERVARERRRVPVAHDAGDAVALLASAVDDDADALPGRNRCEDAVSASIATSPGPVGHTPAESRNGLKRSEPGSTLPPSCSALPRDTTLPSAPTISASAPTAPPAAATPGSRSILPSVEAGNGGASAPPKAALPGHDRVGLRVHTDQERPEARVDRVGEDVGAAHHPDPHHDRERGQREPELAREQVLERDPDHDPSCSSASMSGQCRTDRARADDPPTSRVRVDEPGLVGEHDRLDAVAQVELLEDVRDVRLDGRLADVELLADLGVREAAGDQAEDVALALGQLVELLAAASGAGCA